MRARRSRSPSALPPNQHRLPRQHTFRSEPRTLAHHRDGVTGLNGGTLSGRNWGARMREYESQGMRLVFLGNEALRIGINANEEAKHSSGCISRPTLTSPRRFVIALER